MKEFFKKHFFLFVIIISAGFNYSLLEYNNQFIRNVNPENVQTNAGSLVADETVWSVDNEYYLTPVENYLSGNGWRRGKAISTGEYFRRVPGYSLLYLGFIKIFGESDAFAYLKYFQLLLFLTLIPVFYRVARYAVNEWFAKILTIAFALVPYISSWTYYTLTESISPALTLFYVWLALKGFHETDLRKKRNSYILSSVFFAAAVLTRPYIALAGVILTSFAVKDFILSGLRFKNSLRNLFLISMLPVLMLGAWVYRNYKLSGEFVLLEKAFHPTSHDRMKPEFRGLFSFAKCWGEDGSKFTGYHEPFFWKAVEGDTSSGPIHHILSQWPESVVQDFGYDSLFRVLKRHQGVISKMQPYFSENRPLPDKYLPEQLAMEVEYNQLKSHFMKKNPFQFWVGSRLTFLRRMIFHSHTSNLEMFQPQHNLTLPVYLYKLALLMFHIFIYASLFINFFIIKKFSSRLVFVITPILFLVFFAFIHREIEQRYMLPVLPLLIAGSALATGRILNLFRKTSAK